MLSKFRNNSIFSSEFCPSWNLKSWTLRFNLARYTCFVPWRLRSSLVSIKFFLLLGCLNGNFRSYSLTCIASIVCFENNYRGLSGSRYFPPLPNLLLIILSVACSSVQDRWLWCLKLRCGEIALFKQSSSYLHTYFHFVCLICLSKYRTFVRRVYIELLIHDLHSDKEST